MGAIRRADPRGFRIPEVPHGDTSATVSVPAFGDLQLIVCRVFWGIVLCVFAEYGSPTQAR